MWGRKERVNTCVACVAAVAVSACLCLACGREQAMSGKVENISVKEAVSSSGAVAASLPGVNAGADEGGQPSQVFYGEWKIKETTGTGYIFSDSSPAEDYIGGTVIIEEDSIRCEMPNGELSARLENPVYRVTMQSAKDFFGERYANYDSFGFADREEVPLIEVMDGKEEWDEFGGRMWVKDRDHLVFSGPQYFLAVREGAADEDNSLETVRKAYGEILDKGKYANEKEDMEGYYFAVSDLDFNGIPELVLREGLNLLYPAEYYTFEQGEVVELSGPDEGYPVPGGLYLSRERGSYAFMRGGTMEKSWHVIMEYKIKGHEIVLTDSWDAEWDDDWFGKKNPIYKRNEKGCGEDEFMATYRSYEDNDIEFVPNTKKNRKSVLERGE